MRGTNEKQLAVFLTVHQKVPMKNGDFSGSLVTIKAYSGKFLLSHLKKDGEEP